MSFNGILNYFHFLWLKKDLLILDNTFEIWDSVATALFWVKTAVVKSMRTLVVFSNFGLLLHSRRNRSYLFRVVLNHWGCTPRGVKGSEILWEIQKYSLPGQPSSQNWIKSITICHFLRNFDEFPSGFWFYSILAGWLTWQLVFLNFSQNFWTFDTLETPGSVSAVFAEIEIWNRLKQFLPVCDWSCEPVISRGNM